MNEIKELLWELKNVTKVFPGVKAINNLSLKIYSGEVHGMIGENGSGKSTLVKCLSGVYQPTSGKIFYRGNPIVIHDPMMACSLGVATIYQELSLVPSLTVAENIYIGRLPRKERFPFIVDWQEIVKKSSVILKKLGIDLDPLNIVADLSIAQQQMVEIAKALSRNANLIIMDEPSAAIGMEETKRLHEIVLNMAMQGYGIIYITHRLDELSVMDRVTVLKDGEIVGDRAKGRINVKEIVNLMIGHDVKEHYPKQINQTNDALLTVSDIHTKNGVNGVSFTVYQGEVFGLAGSIGSGRTEIGHAIFGIDDITDGSIKLQNCQVVMTKDKFTTPREAIKCGVALLTENRKYNGLFMNFNGVNNVSIAKLKKIVHRGILDLNKEEIFTKEYIDKLKITPTAVEQSVEFLSGGNQQKVIIARWMFCEANIFILDEPTQGIDIGAKVEVYRLINDITSHGKGVIFISSDFEELLAMSDRIGIVNKGKIIAVKEVKNINKKYLIEKAFVSQV